VSIERPKYYSLPLKSAVNIMTDAERGMKMLSSALSELIKKNEVETWDSTPIPDYMDGYLNAKVIVDFVKKKIESPDEAVKEYLKENNINGLLFTVDELTILYTLVSNYEQNKVSLKKQYGFSTLLN
jgi:hypothetical protein